MSEGQETIEVTEGMERLELTREEEGIGGGDEDNDKESSQTTTPQEEEQPQLSGTLAVLTILKFYSMHVTHGSLTLCPLY